MMHTSRKTFGDLFQSVYQKGIGVEIGVQHGYNSQLIKESGWKGELVCVDIWEDKDAYKVFQEIKEVYSLTEMKGKSVDCANIFSDESLDFVYIDADHSYESVKADFNAWYPKVRTGGIISGHDYGENDCIGVKQFIDEFMKLNPSCEMKFTYDDFWNLMEYQSWWMIKK